MTQLNLNSTVKPMSAQEAIIFPPRQESFSLVRKLAIWVLLSSYFICVLIWISPEGTLKSVLLPFITPIAQATGICQSWSVFSPDVREANYHETALISFKDGLLKLYEFPRMQKLSIWERFRREKYRKMFFDCMPWPDHQQFLPDFAQYVADANSSISNPPEMVSFIHHHCRTPQPEPQHWVNRSDLPEHTGQTTYYVYYVRQKGSQ
jgi:hypothetical protein